MAETEALVAADNASRRRNSLPRSQRFAIQLSILVIRAQRLELPLRIIKPLRVVILDGVKDLSQVC
jgi:hypothetical protein